MHTVHMHISFRKKKTLSSHQLGSIYILQRYIYAYTSVIIYQACLRSSSLLYENIALSERTYRRCINSIALKTQLKYEYKMECIQLSSANVKINIVYFYKVWLVEVSRASVIFFKVVIYILYNMNLHI